MSAPFSNLALDPDERSQVRVVDVAPASARRLDELEHDRQPGRAAARPLDHLGPQPDGGEGGLDAYLELSRQPVP